jgi:hypothetical protein
LVKKEHSSFRGDEITPFSQSISLNILMKWMGKTFISNIKLLS